MTSSDIALKIDAALNTGVSDALRITSKVSYLQS